MSEMRADTHHDAERAPELAELHLREKPDGPGAAAMVAAGIGIFVLGLMTVLSEASVPIHDFLERLEFGRGVGPLAGKTIIAVIAWAVSWAILAVAWRGKDVNIRTWFAVGLALGMLGAVGTFPPLFRLFAP
jgi:hypothetical protein